MAILGLESCSINDPRAFESALQIDLCDVKEVPVQGGNNVAMGELINSIGVDGQFVRQNSWAIGETLS